MDAESKTRLIHLLRRQRLAALGTLRSDGGPLVSQVLFLAAPDFSAFYMLISRLAQHTQDILRDPRISLMIAEPDDGLLDPQTLGRISLRGEARPLPNDDPAYAGVRAAYLDKFPQAAVALQLGDFMFYRLEPMSARYVAGLGKTFNLNGADLRLAAAL